MTEDDNYTIPLRLRKIENLHVVFWLLKDLSWCLVFRPLGIAMIFPTLGVSLWITHKQWSHLSERYHNIAVTAWIVANAYWMSSEFFDFDTKFAFAHVMFKQLTLIPFSVGMISLLYFYSGKIIKMLHKSRP